MTPNAATSGMARPRYSESSAAQSVVAIATAAMSSAAAFAKRAKRSWTRAPPK